MRNCPRTLDKPVLLFGLEVEDVACVFTIIGLGCLFVGPWIPGCVGIALWILMIRFKKDKPAGYVLHWLYNFGMKLPGLIEPPKIRKSYTPWKKQ